MTRRMSTDEARERLDELLDTIRIDGAPVSIEDKGRVIAVLISPEDYEAYREMAKESFFRTVDRIQERNKDADPDEVLADVTEAVEAVRQEAREAGLAAAGHH